MDNQRDAARKGRHRNPSMPGESHPLAKLTESEVKWMRYLHQAGTINQRQEAIKLGVSPSVISQIVKGKSWKHLIR
jgi:DNA-binding MarR family transcriptional regulator